MQTKKSRQKYTKHGMTGSKTLSVWAGMMRRCYEESHTSFKEYGAKGIKVDKRWHNFLLFFEDMGFVPAGMTLDRIDPNYGYGKDNCRWATVFEQSINKKQTIKINNDALKVLCKKQNVNYYTAWSRLKNGASIEQIFSKKRIIRNTLSGKYAKARSAA